MRYTDWQTVIQAYDIFLMTGQILSLVAQSHQKIARFFVRQWLFLATPKPRRHFCHLPASRNARKPVAVVALRNVSNVLGVNRSRRMRNKDALLSKASRTLRNRTEEGDASGQCGYRPLAASAELIYIDGVLFLHSLVQWLQSPAGMRLDPSSSSAQESGPPEPEPRSRVMDH
jgi:hypothetical protein